MVVVRAHEFRGFHFSFQVGFQLNYLGLNLLT